MGRTLKFLFCGIALFIFNASFAQTTYYSFASGDWEVNTSWTLSSDGSSGAVGTGIFPSGTDNVVIRSGHTITVNNTDDNGNEVTPNGVGLPNTGSHSGAGALKFYQAGDLIIASGGTLTSTVDVMTSGYFLVEDGGTFSTAGNNDELVILGSFQTFGSASVSIGGNLILSGNSHSDINSVVLVDDDLIVDHTAATACGSGEISTGNGGPNPSVSYTNSATTGQICSSFAVTCGSTNCSGFTSGPPSGASFTGSTGPGGVGDQTNNQLWLKADDLSLTDGSAVTSWDDASGNGLSALSDGVAANDPTFNDNSVNGLPSLSFDGTDYLNLGNVSSLNYLPGTDSWSFLIVFNAPGTTPQGTLFSKATSDGATRQYQYSIDDNAGNSQFTVNIGGNFITGSVTATNAWVASTCLINTTTANSWTNETTNFSSAIGTNSVPTTDVLIGARRNTAPSTGTGFLYTGSLSEIAMYDGLLNLAQRVITTNYLAAKYGITLSANDVYDMDDSGNGDYDYDVAGIGQASDGTYHKDAQGSGLVRVWNADNLGNGEFLMWGRDAGSITDATTSDVDGVVIEERLSRVWRVAETGDVGAVSISFDYSQLDETPVGSSLRLLIDRDGDGFADNDVTPIVGAASAGIVTFSNVNLQDGDRFTLGNGDLSNPLPITLLYFNGEETVGAVALKWATASEIDNDFFTVERSVDGQNWSIIETLPGAGTSSQLLTYSTNDHNPPSGLVYYRLKQTDFDGKYEYSETIVISVNGVGTQLYVTPNPSTGLYQVRLPGVKPDEIRFFDSQGRRVDGQYTYLNGLLKLDIVQLPTGIYFVQVPTEQSAEVFRLIKR